MEELRRWIHELAQAQRELAERVAALEDWRRAHEAVAIAEAHDLEALKLADRERTVEQRLTVAVGSVMGTLLVGLLIAIATRGL